MPAREEKRSLNLAMEGSGSFAGRDRERIESQLQGIQQQMAFLMSQLKG